MKNHNSNQNEKHKQKMMNQSCM